MYTHTYSTLVEKKWNNKKINAKEAGELKQQRKTSGMIA